MTTRTKIEWTEATWNPVTGCTPISPGCAHCYARRMAKRLAGRCGYPAAPHEFDVTLHPDKLGEPLRWKKPRRVFVCSMSDLFHENVPFEFIRRIFRTMEFARAHTFQVLTKRADRMHEFVQWYASDRNTYWPSSNVWLGVTAENQEQADKRTPLLLQTPAAVRFVSVEPMLGLIEMEAYWGARPGWGEPEGLDWVICGGETGPGARPMHPGWVRSLRDQCREAAVPFFFKSWGDWALKGATTGKPSAIGVLSPDGEWYPGYTGWNGRPIDPDTGEAYLLRVGKKASGRLLDGREWSEYPEQEQP